MSLTAPSPDRLDQLWFTRCTVPTAAGVAYARGWLADELTSLGITLASLQDVPDDQAGRDHFTHGLLGLIREGGSIPAIWARAEGVPTRLLGLTWVDERQVVVARPGSGITGPEDLGGRTAAVAADTPQPPAVHRPMALKGLANALELAGLTLDDITVVDVASSDDGSGIANWGLHPDRVTRPWPGLLEVAEGVADVAYAKGPLAVDEVARLGLEVVVDLDAAPIEARVNNGTPRPITVRQELLDEHGDLVIRLLARILDAAEWAATDRDGVLAVLAGETLASVETAGATYTGPFHERLHPTLDPERVSLLGQEISFLVDQGVVAPGLDLAAWVDPAPLAAAHALRAERSDVA